MEQIVTCLKPCLKSLYEILKPYLTVWSILMGIGVLVVVWGGIKLIFRYLFYKDYKLKQHIEIIPRVDGIYIDSNNNVTVHLFIINLSPYLRIKIEKISGWIDNAEVEFSGKFNLFPYPNNYSSITTLKRSSISLVEIRIGIDEERRQKILKYNNHKLNVIIEISSGKRNITKGFTFNTIQLRS